MVETRKTNRNTCLQNADLLSILTTSDFYADKEDAIIDEIFTFFLGGMKPIQVATTNLIYYVSKHPTVKERLLAEIMPPLEKAQRNWLEKFTYEMGQQFTYLQWCWQESLRIEPPVPCSAD